ncbi:hypothetical protein NIES4102_08540 [Chondrocystis sp. NIES-4102]|nr:hypothetical protein NIES4102_08540 [Chondrocystis sp. NIES-4102]
MKKLDFALIPFDSKTAPTIEITGTISRQDHQLNIEYLFTGDLATIIIPPPAKTAPTRQYDLWEHTCLEFFLGLEDTTAYWEFNLSPAGNWNVFHLKDYRQDLAEEMVITSLPFTVLQSTDSMQLNLELDLNPIISATQNLEVGITSVVENQDQQLSYWGLQHPASEPDFHQRDTWMIRL